eukprot:GFYU01012963.1.p1 GENE.GFYU01012963.1~~GFYU01012963.1.p1  ORF type:complete len:378 (-),score=64.42 GFYU01012963.1:1030-2163(-)
MLFHLERTWKSAMKGKKKNPFRKGDSLKGLSIPTPRRDVSFNGKVSVSAPTTPHGLADPSPTNSQQSSPRSAASTPRNQPSKPTAVQARRKAQKERDLFNELETDIINASTLEDKADLVEEMSVGVEKSRDVKRLFFESTAIMQFVIEEVRTYSLYPSGKYFRVDELEYLIILLELLEKALADSSTIPQRLNLVNMPKPHSSFDILESMLRGPVIKAKKESTNQSEINKQLEMINILIVGILTEVEDLAVESSLNGQQFSPSIFLGALMRIPNFVESKVSNYFSALLSMLSAPQKPVPPDVVLQIYQHVKFLRFLVVSQPELQQFIHTNYEEDIKYFFKNPDIVAKLQASDEDGGPFVPAIIDYLSEISQLCGPRYH